MSATEQPETQRRWSPAYADISPRREAKHRIADQARELVHRIYQLETEAADDEGLAAVEQRLSEVNALLGQLPDLSRFGGATSAPGEDSNLFERSPLTGRSNPLAAPLHLEFVGERTVGHAIYREAYEGPANLVHGGVVIAAFDDLLGVAQSASGLAGMTGTLTVRLRRPTPLHERIDYEAEVDRVEGRKIFVRGLSTLDGELLAEAEGIFIAAPSGDIPTNPTT